MLLLHQLKGNVNTFNTANNCFLESKPPVNKLQFARNSLMPCLDAIDNVISVKQYSSQAVTKDVCSMVLVSLRVWQSIPVMCNKHEATVKFTISYFLFILIQQNSVALLLQNHCFNNYKYFLKPKKRRFCSSIVCKSLMIAKII